MKALDEYTLLLNRVPVFAKFMFKEVLSVLMLCPPVFISTSGCSALLGRPRCGLSIWLLLIAIFNTLFWVCANFFHDKTGKTRKYSKSAIFLWYENGCRQLLGAQSINTERASSNLTEKHSGERIKRLVYVRGRSSLVIWSLCRRPSIRKVIFEDTFTEICHF